MPLLLHIFSRSKFFLEAFQQKKNNIDRLARPQRLQRADV